MRGAFEAYPGRCKKVLVILKLFGSWTKATNMKCARLTVRAGEPITGPPCKKTTVRCHHWTVVRHNEPVPCLRARVILRRGHGGAGVKNVINIGPPEKF